MRHNFLYTGGVIFFVFDFMVELNDN